MEFKLIDGEFNNSDSVQLLLDLIDYKINAHKLKKFSNDIRGLSDGVNQNRVNELKSIRNDILEFLNSNINSDKIRISADVKIEIIK